MIIQNLIDAATPGSVVNVPSGIYNEQLVIDKPLTLQGPPIGGGVAKIDATNLGLIPAIQILSSDISIKRFTIENGPSHGIQVGSSTANDLTNIKISDNEIRGNGNAGIITNHNSAIKIENNIIENNGIGSDFNRGGIILYPHGTTSITNNTINNNNIDGIFARASESGLVIENNRIQSYANSGITLAWDQRNTSIINNQIRDCGTGNFDEQGGIVIIQSMAEIIQGNTIEGCSPFGIFWGWTPTVGEAPEDIIISNNTIKNSALDAIYLFSQGPGGFIPPDKFPLEPTIENNTLSDNGRAGVYISNLYYYSPGNANPIINYNEIVGNQWGVLNNTAQIVDATNNWWGNNSGPFNSALNHQGTGDSVSDNVDFIPWLTRTPIIRILKCLIREVNLEKHTVTRARNGAAIMNLFIKVLGDVYISINGAITVLRFETEFCEDILVQALNLNNIRPYITHTSACYATLDDNVIKVEIGLSISVVLQGKYTILVPVYNICPVPRIDYRNTAHVKALSPVNLNEREDYSHECINVEAILNVLKFTKTLLHDIEISDLT